MTSDTPDDSTPTTPPGQGGESQIVAPPEAEHPLVTSQLGSGLLAQQPTAEAQASVAVLKVCPQCGTEYETAARFCPADGTALRPKGSDSLVGSVLADRYHILKRIGEGGMGRVYLGEHVKMNRQCAIKVMSPALVNDAESASRFAREASNAARIIHPNVAAVFDYGESDGLVYLVMEYVDGEPLSRLLAREAPFSLERSTDLGRQIADALGAAHELGIVHRDLKPDNILVARSKSGKEVVKVVDFGIAKAMQEGAGEALTRTGLVIGTPEFMSPEQLLGDPVDARSDLYALGCILHLMLTASPAFEAPTREQMIKRRLSEEPPHVQLVDPGLPDSIDRIIGRLLARSPVDRYGTAAEVRDALGGTHARRMSVDGAPLPRLDTPRSAPTLVFDAATTGSEAAKTPVATRPRWGLWWLSIFVVVMSAVAVMLVLKARQQEVVRVAKVRADSISRARDDSSRRADSVALAAIPAVPMIDTALARQKALKDSIAHADSTNRAGVLGAISSWEKAIQRRDTLSARLLPEHEKQLWQSYLEQGDLSIRSDPRTTIRWSNRNTVADADLSLKVTFIERKSKSRLSIPQRPLHAHIVKRGTIWVIESLTPIAK